MSFTLLFIMLKLLHALDSWSWWWILLAIALDEK